MRHICACYQPSLARRSQRVGARTHKVRHCEEHLEHRFRHAALVLARQTLQRVEQLWRLARRVLAPVARQQTLVARLAQLYLRETAREGPRGERRAPHHTAP
jgi:hypothetical protein